MAGLAIAAVLASALPACGARAAWERSVERCGGPDLPAHPDLAHLRVSLAAADPEPAIRIAIELVEQLQREAAGLFHAGASLRTDGVDPAPGAAPDDAARRAFLDRFVFVDPPLLGAAGPGFLWNDDLVRAVAHRALQARRPDLVQAWFAALAPFSYSDQTLAACRAPDTRRHDQALGAPAPGASGVAWTRSSF